MAKLSYLRFVPKGPVPDIDLFASAFTNRGFCEIDPDGEVKTSVGWVRDDNPFATEWPDGVFDGHLVAVKLRVDTLKIPAKTMREHLRADEREHMRTLARALTRPEKDQIKADVLRYLRRRTMPKMLLVDVLWDLNTGIVRLFSTSRPVAGFFVELFERTFSVGVQILGPMTVLAHRGVSDDDIQAIAETPLDTFRLGSRIDMRAQIPPAHADRFANLGTSFLLWLWYHADRNAGSIDVADVSVDVADVSVALTERIVLESDGVTAETCAISSCAPSDAKEARAALRTGKHVARARLSIYDGQNIYDTTVDGSTLVCSSVKLPAVLDSDNLEERLLLLDTFELCLDQLFVTFARLHLDPVAWPAEAAAIADWKHND